MLSAPHPPPELMELRQAEPLRVLQHHHRGVGHIDPHLYDRGGHQHIDVPGGELLHDPVLVPGAHLSVEMGHAYALRQNVPQLFRVVHHILQGRPALGVLRVPLHLGADDIGLPPLLHLLCDELVGLGPIGGVHHAVLDGQPVGGQFVDHRDMQVPVQDDGQGPGNGGGAHDQDMGIRALFRQPLPLPDPEPMLLVRHRQGQGLILYLLLDQGMGADDQIGLPGGNPAIGLPLLLRRHGAHQEHRPENQAVSLHIILHRLEMLHGQHFRRSHQRPLIPVGGSRQKRQQSHDRLAGAHVPLDQAVHAVGPLHVRLDLLPDLALGPGQGKGEPLQETGRVRRLRHPETALQLPAEIPVLSHQEQEFEEFVEDQPFPGQD